MDFWLPGVLVMLVLLFAGLPIAFAMGIVGFAGFALLQGTAPAFYMVGQVAFDTGKAYSLSVVPLFILMGNLIVRAGLAEQLYGAAFAWLGHYRGGLGMATIAACGGFSAVCGSSLATAATMAKVAMPSMRRYGYADTLATGVIAAGGTLGILIPPSVIMVIYGIMTSTDIGKLFLAGILPGIVGVLGYMLATRLSVWMNPAAAPRTVPAMAWRERLKATRGVADVLALFVLVIGGIYVGAFTATEAAGIGAAGSFAIALWKRALDWRSLYAVLADTARTTAMMFVVLIGAVVFTNFINLAGLPKDLHAFLAYLDLGPTGIILFILVVYLILGCILESLSMILLTVPIFFPIVQGLGHDPIWFGIVIVVVTEISLITPPVGLNVFVLRSVLRDVETGTIFRGVTPFILIDIVRLLLLVFVPWITLVVPRSM